MLLHLQVSLQEKVAPEAVVGSNLAEVVAAGSSAEVVAAGNSPAVVSEDTAAVGKAEVIGIRTVVEDNPVGVELAVAVEASQDQLRVDLFVHLGTSGEYSASILRCS